MISPTPARGCTPEAPIPAETPGDAWRGWVVAVVLAATAPIGYLGNEGIAPLAALGGLLTLPVLLRTRAPSLGVWILLTLTAWAVASFTWSPLEAAQLAHLHGYNAIQALTAPKLAFQLVLYGALVVAARRLAPRGRRRALWAMAVSVLAVVVLLLVEGVIGGAIYGRLSDLVGQHWPPDLMRRNAARGCYAAAVLFWPAAAVLWRRDFAGAAIGAALASALGALLLGVDAPVLAFVFGAVAFLVVQRLGRRGALACLAASTVYFLAAPWPFLTQAASGHVIPTDVGKLSWRVRLDVWRFASAEVAHRPVFGWGLDSSRLWPDRIPMHPHDSAIQLWLELGVVGAILGAAFFAWLFWRIGETAREDRTAAAVMAATAGAYLTIGAVSFGVWQEWWLATGAVALAACAMLLQTRRDGDAAWGEAELVELGLVSAP